MISLSPRFLLWALVALAGLVSGYLVKRHFTEFKHRAEVIETQKAAIARLETKLVFEQITQKVVTKYVDRVQVIRGETKTIIKEVPIYVTPEDDANCVVPDGFVRLHDAAVQGRSVASTPGATDAAPSDTQLSEVAITVVENYGVCRETAEQLTALQRWIRETHVQEEAR